MPPFYCCSPPCVTSKILPHLFSVQTGDIDTNYSFDDDYKKGETICTKERTWFQQKGNNLKHSNFDQLLGEWYYNNHTNSNTGPINIITNTGGSNNPNDFHHQYHYRL